MEDSIKQLWGADTPGRRSWIWTWIGPDLSLEFECLEFEFFADHPTGFASWTNTKSRVADKNVRSTQI